MSILLSIIAFVIVFSILILVHEAGHFSVAKFFKVKVEEFGLGLPPKAKTLFKKDGTDYTLNWIPFGGFVRMLGEDDLTGTLGKKKDSFSAKPVWQRAMIACAGVFMNFLLAYVVMTLLFFIGFKPMSIIPDSISPIKADSYIFPTYTFALKEGLLEKNPNITSPVTIEKTEPGSPAEKLGIQPKTSIVKLNETSFESADEYRMFYKNIPMGTNMTFTFKDANGNEFQKSLKKDNDLLGMYLSPSYLATDKAFPTKWYEAPILAGVELKNQILFTGSAIGGLFINIFEKFSLPKDIGGPFAIASAVHQATQIGFLQVLLLMIVLSINLGVFNILPFPALDGGRLLFMIVEVISRRKTNQHLEITLHYIGYMLLIALLLAVTYQDIARLIFK